MTLDSSFVRAQFPALHGDWTFFDNAGGSQTLGQVVRRIEEYLTTSDVQLGATYDVSRVAEERVTRARGAVAKLFNARDTGEVVMGPSTSMMIRILASCLSRTLREGDEVIVTDCDHEANIGPWRELESVGVGIKTWHVDPETWSMPTANLEKLITDRTRLIAVTHASNVIGTINPIAEITRIAHDRGVKVCVDGVAFAPHRRVDVQALDVDFYTTSFYKVYGPHYAVLYGKKEHLLDLPTFNHFFIGNDDLPYKFQPGNVNYELSYGMMGLWDYFDALASAHDIVSDNAGDQLDAVFDLISRHEEVIAARLLDYLRTKSNVRIIGLSEVDRNHRVPTISFVVDGRPSDTISEHVDTHKIGIRFGDFYARRLIDGLRLSSLNGVVRVSMVHYNTVDEVDRLIRALDEVL